MPCGLRHPYCPMPHMTISASTTLLLLMGGPAAIAAPGIDSLDLPAACASVGAASLRQAPSPAAGFDATGFRVRLPPRDGAVAPSMQATRLHVTGQAGTPVAALERAASASAAALLIALTGSGHSGCPTVLLRDAGDPIVQGLQDGGSYLATWQDVTLRGGGGHVAASRMQLRLEAAGGAGNDRLVHVTLTLDGITGVLTQPTLLPDRIALRVTLPASSLPTLLAATGGGAPDAQIPVTVDDVSVTRGQAVLHGHGEATAAATPLDSTARLHLTARHYDDLVSQAALHDLTRLHTALFLSGLVGRRSGDALDWDVDLADGLLAVNNVPIPLR